ncbi:MAG TPA: isocitrate lyase/phosphoenolpyruvate mutase family protein [Pseudonocardiaceae bacterium]|nr:isocitrate lyase/phosphoenolpyruvate mutase family protein [Pseudonocardiaceae bacterium]
MATANGLPDAEGMTRDETLALARRLGTLNTLVTVDIEAGFSTDPGEVADLVAQLAEWGVVGINIEDGRGDHLADPEQQSALVKAVRDRVPGIFINARADNYWLGIDQSVPAVLDRARHYTDAGADGIFVPRLAEPGEIAAVTEAVPLPINVLYVKELGLRRLGELGVHRVSTGSLLFRTAMRTAVDLALDVRRT